MSKRPLTETVKCDVCDNTTFEYKKQRMICLKCGNSFSVSLRDIIAVEPKSKRRDQLERLLKALEEGNFNARPTKLTQGCE
jgi:hypothetical protein